MIRRSDYPGPIDGVGWGDPGRIRPARRVDVRAELAPIVAAAHRQFDAAMDELVPPTVEQRAARRSPAGYQLGVLFGCLQQAAEDLVTAFAAGKTDWSGRGQ